MDSEGSISSWSIRRSRTMGRATGLKLRRPSRFWCLMVHGNAHELLCVRLARASAQTLTRATVMAASVVALALTKAATVAPLAARMVIGRCLWS